MSTVTERRGTIGTVKGTGESEVFQPKANFCLKIVAKVEGTKDGYIARVTRAPDNVTRDCFFCASSAMHKNEFVQAINAGFSSGGMFCTLSDVDLGNYLLEKVMDFMKEPHPRTLQAVSNVGQQETSPPIFVLSPELHLNDEGFAIDSDDQRSYFDYNKIEPRLIPSITTPYRRSVQPLLNLWDAVSECAQHNRGSALLTFGAVAMNMHFQTLVELKGGAPVVVLYGEPDVGKTTIANAAMSVAGIEACSFRGMRREFFVHLASQTSLGLLYDDPNKVQEVENIIVDFYNGMTRGSFKRGLETPRCGFMLACNFSLGKIQRLLSRVVIIPYKGPSIQARTVEQQRAFSALKRLKEEASKSIGFYIALGKKYREEGVFEVDTHEQELAKVLPNCGGRTIKGYANLIWFTEQVAELVGETKDLVWDIISKFAPQLDQLQQKDETITSATPLDPDVISDEYWKKVANNLIDLAKKFNSRQQVRAFLQLGKNAGKPSISVAVEVASDLMVKKGITPKFTLDELRDNITQYNCGTRGQSRKFHQLDRDFNWHGSMVALKVPVIHLNVFPEDIQQILANIISEPSSTSTSKTASRSNPTPSFSGDSSLSLEKGDGSTHVTDEHSDPEEGSNSSLTGDSRVSITHGDISPSLKEGNSSPSLAKGDGSSSIIHGDGLFLTQGGASTSVIDGDASPSLDDGKNSPSLADRDSTNASLADGDAISSLITEHDIDERDRCISRTDGNNAKDAEVGHARRQRKRAAESLLDSLHQGLLPSRSRRRQEKQ